MAEKLLEIKGLNKSFPGVKALDNVDFSLAAGEIRALVGENGAGKSTMIKILAGIYQKNSGSIYFKGQKVEIKEPAAARKLGLAFIHQDVNLIPYFNAIENIWLGYQYPKNNGFFNKTKMKEKVLELADKLNLPVVVHSRKSGEETLEVIDSVGDFSERLIFHCYAYGPKLIEKIIERDYYAAFGGLITFGSAAEIREALKKMPLDRLLLETDSPYLTPSPNRGKRNEPANLQYIVKKAAEILEVDPEELAEITSKNAEKIYKI